MPQPIPFDGFVGSAWGSQSPNVDSQDLLNMYLERSDAPRAKGPQALFPAPGFDSFCVLPKSPVRGLFAQNNRTFAVGDDTLYEVDRTGNIIATYPMTVLATPSTPNVTNSPLTPAIDTPGQPIITNGGALGSTTWGYKVTAMNALGETTGSIEGLTTVGNATLSPTNYNLVTWEAVDGATGYKVYRTTGPGSGELIGVVTGVLQLQDTGQAGTVATPPVSNTTGEAVGTTRYGYQIVARLGIGHTAAGPEGATVTGQATLDSVNNWNILTWPAVPNAHSYDVYRVEGGVTQGLIANTSDTTLNDTGLTGDGSTAPASDTTSTFTLVNDGNPVTWASSGDQLIIGSGGAAYCFDLTASTLGKVVDGCTAVGFVESYFIALDAATSQLKSSESFDGYSWDATQIYERELAGDGWLSMAVSISGDIYLLGSNTSDVYRFTGDNTTRFAPFQNIQIEQGIIAPLSIDFALGQSLMWLGQNDRGAGIVWRGAQYQALQISTRGIEQQLERYTTLADAIGFSYQQQGHHFYILTFPTADKTWVFDDLTKEWHRRAYLDPTSGLISAYRPWCHAFAFGGVGFGKHLVGDSKSGTIAALNLSTATDINGSPIQRVRQSPHVSVNMQFSTVWSLVIDLQPGLGTLTGQGVDPQVMLQYSKNGGMTWSKEIWRSAGKRGKYLWRVKFGRLGSARDWVFRIVMTDPIAWRLVNAYFEPEGGIS